MNGGQAPFLESSSDYFVGRRGRLKRYLVCAMAGYFPVQVRHADDTLSAVLRTGAPHLGVTGTLSITHSSDGGRAWSDAVPLWPRFHDVRNPALGINAAGELVVAAWRLADPGVPASRALFTRVGDAGGAEWAAPVEYASTLVSRPSPYGRMVSEPDGTLLMSIYGAPAVARPGVRHVCALARSTDGGRSWGDESLVAEGFNEASYARLPDGRLLCAARSEEKDASVAVLTSVDRGRTWSAPQPVTRAGEHPADLTVLGSGAVLLTFGRRVRPLGCGALISRDGGASWERDREVLLAADGVETADLGYPSTVELSDGRIVTLMYYASGSEATALNWGAVSCQAIHYSEKDL